MTLRPVPTLTTLQEQSDALMVVKGDRMAFRWPISQVEGWHAPAGRPDLWTPASCTGQADQTGSAGGCLKPGARPTDRLAGQPVRRQPNRRSGRDPGPRPYARIPSKPGKPGRKAGSTIHSLPAEYLHAAVVQIVRLSACRSSSYGAPPPGSRACTSCPVGSPPAPKRRVTLPPMCALSGLSACRIMPFGPTDAPSHCA